MNEHNSSLLLLRVNNFPSFLKKKNLLVVLYTLSSSPPFPNSFPRCEGKKKEWKGKEKKLEAIAEDSVISWNSWAVSSADCPPPRYRPLPVFRASVFDASHYSSSQRGRRENLRKGINSEEGCVFTVGKSWRKTRHFVPCNESKLGTGKVYCSGSTDASKIINTVSLVCFCSCSSFVSSQLREISVSSSVLTSTTISKR